MSLSVTCKDVLCRPKYFIIRQPVDTVKDPVDTIEFAVGPGTVTVVLQINFLENFRQCFSAPDIRLTATGKRKFTETPTTAIADIHISHLRTAPPFEIRDIPTLSTSALVALGCLLLMAGMRAMRSRRR